MALLGEQVGATTFRDVPIIEDDAELAAVLAELDFLKHLEIEDTPHTERDAQPQERPHGPAEALGLFEDGMPSQAFRRSQ